MVMLKPDVTRQYLVPVLCGPNDVIPEIQNRMPQAVTPLDGFDGPIGDTRSRYSVKSVDRFSAMPCRFSAW